jgi:hypothetical protein
MRASRRNLKRHKPSGGLEIYDALCTEQFAQCPSLFPAGTFKGLPNRFQLSLNKSCWKRSLGLSLLSYDRAYVYYA